MMQIHQRDRRCFQSSAWCNQRKNGGRGPDLRPPDYRRCRADTKHLPILRHLPMLLRERPKINSVRRADKRRGYVLWVCPERAFDNSRAYEVAALSSLAWHDLALRSEE